MKSPLTIAALSLLFLTSVVHAASPVGRWMARSIYYDSQPIGVIKLYVRNHELRGELIRVLPLNGDIKGSWGSGSGPVMMFGFRKNGHEWVGGKIYEQKAAKLYECNVKVSQDGKHLYVTGWKWPFSQTVTWDRV